MKNDEKASIAAIPTCCIVSSGFHHRHVPTYSNLAVFEAFRKRGQYGFLMLFFYDTRRRCKYPESSLSLAWIWRLTRYKENL